MTMTILNTSYKKRKTKSPPATMFTHTCIGVRFSVYTCFTTLGHVNIQCVCSVYDLPSQNKCENRKNPNKQFVGYYRVETTH